MEQQFQSIPLSQSQMGIYIESLQHTGELVYHMPFLYTLPKAIDLERLREAILRVAAAHPAFFSHYTSTPQGEPCIEIRRDRSLEIEIEAVADIESVKSQLARRFDLKDATPIHIRLFSATEQNYMLFEIHHIVADGASAGVLMEEIDRAYRGEEIAPEEYTFEEVTLEEERLRGGSEAYDAAQNWYRENLNCGDVESLLLSDLEQKEYRIGRMEQRLDLNLDQLNTLMQQTGVKKGTLFTSAFALLLSKFAGEEEVLFSTIWHGRHDKRMARTMGMFVKTLPLYFNLRAGMTLQELFDQGDKMISGTRRHHLFSYADAHTRLGLKSNCLFVYQGYLFNNLQLDGHPITMEDLEESATTEPISIQIYQEREGGYRAVVEYHAHRYSEELIGQLLDSYTALLNGMKCAEEPLEHLPILTPRQIALLDGFNATENEEDPNRGVLDYFAEQVRLKPDHPAVVFRDRSYTYRQVDHLSNQIAHLLLEQGAQPEEVISVMIPRSEWMAIASLGVLKAGCAYQPLDPSYPLDRLRFMMQDASVRILITERELYQTVSPEAEQLLYTNDFLALSLPETAPEVEIMPRSLFILLYTSGSTGLPKGCMLEHRNVAAFARSHARTIGLGADSRVAAYASYGFDAALMDVYGPLTSGSTLHILPEEIRLDLVALADYFDRHHITDAFMTTQVGYQFVTGVECRDLRTFMVGGEKLATLDPPQNLRLYNAYGPTESCCYITAYHVARREENIPIGGAVPNTKLYVVDSRGERLPVGAVGELWVAGRQVSRGYLNREEQSRKAFTKNPFSEDPAYDRVYHTGDIVRYLPDGNIQFVGRRDGQVKIRGFRIELKEIEAVIRQFPSIRDVTVQAFDQEGGGKYIAAYIVSPEQVDISALEAFIREEKPPYLVPAVTMQIDRIPLNQNQKVDKRALPKPEKPILEAEEESHVPMNRLEEELHQLLSGVVGSDQFGIMTPLAYVGLTSISAIKLATLIYKRFGVSLDSKALIKSGTIQSIENEILTHLLEGGTTATAAAASESETASDQESAAPLTYAQQGVYFECMKHPLETTYNIPFRLDFPSTCDADLLRRSLVQLVELHPELRVRFQTCEDQIVQCYDPQMPVEVEWQSATAADLQRLGEEFVRPFHLAKGPLFRFLLVQTEQHLSLLADLHHLVADGASVDLFIRQLCLLIEGRAPEREQCSYLRFAREQQQAQAEEAYRRAEAFFAESLCVCEGCSELPEDYKVDASTGKSRRLSFPFDLERVEALCRELELTPAHALLGVLYYTLSRYTNSRHIYLATVSSGRSNLAIADTMGMFVNTLALHGEIRDESVGEFLRAVSRNFEQSLENENYPFARIATEYGFAFSTNYAYQIGVLNRYELNGVEIPLSELRLETPKQKLDVMICQEADGAVIRLQYNDALYQEETIRRFGESLLCVLEAFLENPKRNLLKVSMVGEKQQQELASLRRVAEGEAPFQLLHRAVEHWAAEDSEAIALVACDATLSRGAFNRQANRIAHALIKRGVKRGDRVALLLPRTSRLLLAMVGVLKAGAAYIPCDPEYPADRVRLILEDSGTPFLLTTAALLAEQKEGYGLDIEQLLDDPNEENPDVELSPEDLAYLIYTSGSTGRPKGVMLRHGGICNYLCGHPSNVFANAVMECAERILSVTTISFDAALQDIGTALYHGKCLVLATEEQANNPLELARFIRTERIDMVSGTPSRWQTWLTSDDFRDAIRSIRIARAGGEKFSTQLLEDLRSITRARIFNCYGPTEITVASNNKELTDAREVTVGRPQLNVEEFVVDVDGNELPVGVVGELYIGGRGVAAGYNKLEEMTRERFIQYRGQRVYRSGDYAKWLPNGDVVILGRTDNQIKLRGLRIELGEIESVIQRVEGIQKVAILIRKVAGKEHLCAYYTASRLIEAEDLKREIAKSLTHYMVPTAYLQLEKMPMTPNGKTDLKSLPEPQFAGQSAYEEPINATERTFCELFASILEVERVGATDNFFDLGGTSLVVTRVIIEADKAGLHIAYGDLFAHPTPRALAALFSEAEGPKEDAEITGYDYTKIHELLAQNNLNSFLKGECKPIKRVLLTGATGYLGIHILKELLQSDVEQIYCLVRGRDRQRAESRLKSLLFYYFDEPFEASFGSRLQLLSGDVTDDLNQLLGDTKVDTLFNCAAVVKHFSEGTEIEDVNIGGARRCVEYCLRHNTRLVHISTASTRGLSVNGHPAPTEVFSEERLYMGQFLGNKYIYSKFMAERLILEAVAEQGLQAKIMRVGNLAARSTDGEFQVNFSTNSFMGRIKVFNMLGCCPYEMRDNMVEFSPINEVADAIVRLATTPSACCLFHPYNNHFVLFGDLLAGLSSVGEGVRFVEGEEFAHRMEQMKSDPKRSAQLSSLLAYQDMAHGQKTADVARRNDYTMQVLYRLGYSWSPTSWDYIDRFLRAIGGMGFFDDELK